MYIYLVRLRTSREICTLFVFVVFLKLILGLHSANERRPYNAVSHFLGANLESALCFEDFPFYQYSSELIVSLACGPFY